MIKMQQTREKLQISRWTITPTYSEILEENKQYAKYCQAQQVGKLLAKKNCIVWTWKGIHVTARDGT